MLGVGGRTGVAQSAECSGRVSYGLIAHGNVRQWHMETAESEGLVAA